MTGRKRVCLTLITLVEPLAQAIGLTTDDLPEPQVRDRQAVNEKLVSQATKLGVTSQKRKRAVDNGVQPFQRLRGKYTAGVPICGIITTSLMHAHYVEMRDGDSVQRRIEFRVGVPNREDGLLTKEQLGKVKGLLIARQFKISGLWVNPSEFGERANLVISPAMACDEHRSFTGLPVVRDEHIPMVTYVEVPD